VFTIARTSSLALAIIAAIIGGLALSRGSMLLHEIVHMRRGALPGYRVAWNALIGIPFLFPSFIYDRVHRDHHRLDLYRTPRDPEHAPDDSTLARRAVLALPYSALLPVVFTVRWLVVAPVSHLHPKLRRWVVEHASSLTTNLSYVPAPLRGHARREALVQEALAFVWTAVIALLVAKHALGLRAIVAFAVVIALGGTLTLLRGEVLHRFERDGVRGTLERQVLDSVNVPHTGIVSALLLPVGVGYHALHHLAPSLPYHAAGRAHGVLLARLPAGSAYHKVTSRGLGDAFCTTLREECPLVREAHRCCIVRGWRGLSAG
jgi:fatty acid desaturase